MSSYVRWSDIRGELVEQAGGEEAVAAGKQELLAEVIGVRLAEARRSRGLTQQQVADCMGVTKGRVSQTGTRSPGPDTAAAPADAGACTATR